MICLEIIGGFKKMYKKQKGFDPFDFTMKQGQLTMGTQLTMGAVGMIGNKFPGGGKISAGMNTMGLLPTIHATGGVFQSLHMLGKLGKKK